MRKLLLIALGVIVATAVAVAPALADGQGGSATKTWRLTITNLTPPGPGAPGSQPLSPPLIVVHSKKADVWSVGGIASHGVAAIAEDANNTPLENALPALAAVKSVATGAGGPIPSGVSRSFEFETSGSFDRLSIVTMLVNTNDAFTGLDALHVRGNGSTVERGAYDAGSEANNELVTHIPGPCCGNAFVRAPEGALIGPHAGITGVGDLDPSVYGWNGAVARFEIEPLP